MAERTITYNEALREGTAVAMAADPSTFLMGLGVPDPKAVFGTTAGLQAQFGPERVLDMPTAENGMTGVAVGAALTGKRPIMVHQRVDFTLLALDQIANSAAKWSTMFNGQGSVPLTIRMIMGRGWGQGPQHSQNLQATYGHFPGLKVVMPSTPHDAKGLLIAAIEDDNPTIVLEHRWLGNTIGHVPEGHYSIELGRARVARSGNDVTLVGSGYSTLESLRAAELLAEDGIECDVIDLRTIKPLDSATIVASAARTGRFVAVDSGWKTFGVAGELVALVSENAFERLKTAPVRVTPPDAYVPTTQSLANVYYPSTAAIVNAVRKMYDLPPKTELDLGFDPDRLLDVPDASFRGPF
jgi:pyruvate/2-oxoglutarate/acetoin dehydrogenase E1 component